MFKGSVRGFSFSGYAKFSKKIQFLVPRKTNEYWCSLTVSSCNKCKHFQHDLRKFPLTNFPSYQILSWLNSQFTNVPIIRDPLRDFLPFVQFKKREKKPRKGVLLWVNLQGLACNFTKSKTPTWGFYTFFTLYKWYQIKLRIMYRNPWIDLHTKWEKNNFYLMPSLFVRDISLPYLWVSRSTCSVVFSKITGLKNFEKNPWKHL